MKWLHDSSACARDDIAADESGSNKALHESRVQASHAALFRSRRSRKRTTPTRCAVKLLRVSERPTRRVDSFHPSLGSVRTVRVIPAIGASSIPRALGNLAWKGPPACLPACLLSNRWLGAKHDAMHTFPRHHLLFSSPTLPTPHLPLLLSLAKPARGNNWLT